MFSIYQALGVQSEICIQCTTKCADPYCPCSWKGQILGPKEQGQPPNGPCLPCAVDCPVLECLVVNPCTPEEVKRYLGDCTTDPGTGGAGTGHPGGPGSGHTGGHGGHSGGPGTGWPGSVCPVSGGPVINPRMIPM